MNTHFAPHQRTSVEDALRQFHDLRSNLYIHELIRALPYIATILVMIFASRRLRAPAFLGQNYDRERRTLA